MSTLTKSMLVLIIINVAASVVFLSGLVNVSGFPGLYVVVPLAAIFYGLFLICRIFQNEMAGYDAEHGTAASQTLGDNSHPSDDSLHGHQTHEPMQA